MAPARADLGDDLAKLRRGLADQGRVQALGLRLLERGEPAPLVLPPWAADESLGRCITLVFVAPAPTQFLVHVQPWPGLPRVLVSSAGALQLTRCGAERVTLLQVRLELRSPRAAVHGLVAVGSDPPEALPRVLPERDAGAAAPLGDAGPEPPREALASRLARFESNALVAGATSVESSLLPSPGYVRLSLAPGCHELLATEASPATPYTLLMGEGDDPNLERLPASERGDVRTEQCSVRGRKLSVSVDAAGNDAERRLAVAHFALPEGLPGRFGPEAAEQLLRALGQSRAPRRLGLLVSTTLGAQGRTPLPRALLPQTCYLAALAVRSGRAQALTLAARAGAVSAEASARDGDSGTKLTFCTDRRGAVELDVEARGLGLTWQLFVFQAGPARQDTP